MEAGYIDKFDIKRITSAVEEEFIVEQIEKGEYTVKSADEPDSDPHIVNLHNLFCSCNDYGYNCTSKEQELDDTKVCKHILHCIFKVHSLV
jgi:hypothetical protein